MAKHPNIRIMERDKKEYTRLRRNVRSKIRRVAKTHDGFDVEGEVDLPNRITDFQTREQFNKWKSDMASFTDRGNKEHQYKTNKFGYTTNVARIESETKKRQQAQENAIKQKEKVDQIEMVVEGEKQGTVGGYTPHMKEGSVTGINVPKDFDFDEVRNEQRMEDIELANEKRADPDYYDKRQMQMMDNFIAVLEGSYNSDADELIDIIVDMNPSDFYELYLSHFADFDFSLYDSDGAIIDDNSDKMEGMVNVAKQYQNQEYDQDMKGF